MAGKRQHFIPQFLQKGFATGNARGEAQTWVFRRDTPPFKSNIANVGVEGKFYTYDGDSEADDLITDAESEFSTLVRALRLNAATTASDPRIPKLIAHLEARTRHLRENLLKVSNAIISEFLDFMSDENKFTNWLIEKYLNDPVKIRQICLKELADKQLPQSLLEDFMRLTMEMGPSLVRLRKREIHGAANALRPRLAGMLREQVKSAHISVLKQSIAPEKKVQMLSNLTYAVTCFDGESLILSDSVVLFNVHGVRSHKTFLERKDRLKAVYVPLDSNAVLVGSDRKITSVPKNLRELLADSSLEYFIAKGNSENNQELQNRIGANANYLTEEDAIAIVKGVIGDID